MNDTVLTRVVSPERREELRAEGERLIGQARAIHAILEEYVRRADEHQQRMFVFKEDRGLNRAEAEGDRVLAEVLYAVCREGEALRRLVYQLHAALPRARA